MIFPNIFTSMTFICVISVQRGSALYDFPKINTKIPEKERDLLNTITIKDLRVCADLGVVSVLKELRLEENLFSSSITVHNGSVSHKQLLETLPTDKANEDSEVALKILKASLYLYNSKCVEHGIKGEYCRAYMAESSIPKDTELWKECNQIVTGEREGHYAFRRLLSSNYIDGLHKMPSGDKLPAARLVSSNLLNGERTNVFNGTADFGSGLRNLGIVQWTKFIEHDLSKPVVMSMKNGYSIECCNHDNFNLQPRFRHPACAPLIEKNLQDWYGRETCLNYVRSALSVNPKCNFGAAEQLNQATGYLDLSQLYGYTGEAEHRMRTFSNGQLKSTKPTINPAEDMLPLATAAPYSFCDFKLGSNDTCFMAGDSRVNSHPFSFILYTIFLRSHNQIAHKLRMQHEEWNDECLFKVSKKINIDIYRRIVFKEWLPGVLGQAVADNIIAESMQGRKIGLHKSMLQISNEFAVAAVRFYYSMMPNMDSTLENDAAKIGKNNSTVITNILALEDHNYKTQFLLNSRELNYILEDLLQKRVMKMDSKSNYMGMRYHTQTDVLAFDIQRGRDHGLQGYVKYLEMCQAISISNWNDLQTFISFNDIQKLKSVYASWSDVDLIVGGISEIPVNDSTVGPTFNCILGEQFSKIYHSHESAIYQAQVESSDMSPYLSWTGANLICANTQVKYVPRNIFKIESKENPLMSCATLFSPHAT